MSSHTLKIILATAVMTLLAACSEAPQEKFTTVTVSGNVQMLAGPVPEGTVHYRLYNLWWLEGDLRHPLEEIEDFTAEGSSFSHTFAYPEHRGTGLALHAWIDTDDDGIFCTPTSRKDPSGMAWSEESPAAEITLNITMQNDCRAANWFYPAAAE